jgi:16S rRNA (cytosine1402-N4)-methyltransferase
MSTEKPHRRRPRYAGTHPRRFAEKYKEHGGDAATLAKVLAAGKTPAGTHRPIMVAEVLAALAPRPGALAVDLTLGYGGHAEALLPRLRPGGRLLGLDADPCELPRTEARLRALGFDESVLTCVRTNFAALPQVLAGARADCILADLGVSSMQLDNPLRGFSTKAAGPLDLRMNPNRGQPAADFLAKTKSAVLTALLVENADEPHATELANALAGRRFVTTTDLAAAIRLALPRVREEERERAVRRVFQALRIAVNDEFGALDSLLSVLPQCLAPGGRVAILTFHSGEDRRVKQALAEGWRTGVYAAISTEVIRPTPAECGANPRATSAKLRWACKS